MYFTPLFLAAAPALVMATLDPCSSNTKGACPSYLGCSAEKVSTAIQAAECSHNTRVSGTQTFAVFTTDHQYDSNHGAPYGTCKAYTCTPPTTSQMNNNTDCWTFFWRLALFLLQSYDERAYSKYERCADFALLPVAKEPPVATEPAASRTPTLESVVAKTPMAPLSQEAAVAPRLPRCIRTKSGVY